MYPVNEWLFGLFVALFRRQLNQLCRDELERGKYIGYSQGFAEGSTYTETQSQKALEDALQVAFGRGISYGQQEALQVLAQHAELQ